MGKIKFQIGELVTTTFRPGEYKIIKYESGMTFPYLLEHLSEGFRTYGCAKELTRITDNRHW